MLDVHRLRVFRAVVASGSVHAAATNLGYTPSTVSQHVAALQRETGLTLLTKVGRGIEPTPLGRELAALSDGVLAQLADVEARVRDLKAGRAGSFTIRCFASAAPVWLPQTVQAVKARFPDLALRVHLYDGSLDDGPVDFDLVSADRDYQGPAGLRTEHLLDEPYVLVVDRDHPLAGEPVVEFARLADFDWISEDSGNGQCGKALNAAAAAAGFTPRYAVETGDHMTALEFSQVGMGLCVLPRLCTLVLAPNLIRIPLKNPTPERSIFVNTQAEADPASPTGVALATLHREVAATRAAAQRV